MTVPARFRAFETTESLFSGLCDPCISRPFPHTGCVYPHMRSDDSEQNLEIEMSWTWKSDRGQGRPQTRLRFESLEERSLLAVAAFDINLYEDVGGTPGDLIADDTVKAGDTFFVEIMAREWDPLRAGLRAVALDIAWDPDSLQEIDEDLSSTITDDLPLFNSGVLDNEAGTITDLRGAAFLAGGVGRPIGNLMPERFALLHFQALESTGSTSISMSEGLSNIVTVPVSSLSSDHLDFETQTITLVSPSQPSSVEEVLPEPAPVAPVPVEPTPSEPAPIEVPAPVAQPAVAAPIEDEGAVLGLQLNLYEDAGGALGDPIVDGTIEIGESFFAQITADDLRDMPLGIGGLSIDVVWNPEVFQEIDQPFEPAEIVTGELPLYQSGSLDQDAGRIDDLGGVSLRSMGQGQPIGTDGPDQFALLHFNAIGTADSSFISLDIGASGVGVVEGSVDSSDDVVIQSPSISVMKSATPPQIEVTATSGPDLETIQFVTQLEDGVSPLVRPVLPDTAQFIDVTNTGPSPLTIDKLQVNAPDVQVTPASGLVLQAGETERLQLTYAPTSPNPQSMTSQSFNMKNGLVILSDAENSPKVEIALIGNSTYDADVTHDGTVNIADVVSFDDHCGVRSGDADYHPSIDPNGDGSVDLGDFGPLNVFYRQTRPAVTTPVAAQATDQVLSGMEQDDVPSVLASEDTDALAAAVAAAFADDSADSDEEPGSIEGPALPNMMLWQ